ncbi:hypothetical protein R1flu_010224 [Riccia fluitans]|uniref:Secreted protein n=1 Tax=Riccia fluitans TaxID=41844 RepID=A0ABD1Z7E9_9MARC
MLSQFSTKIAFWFLMAGASLKLFKSATGSCKHDHCGSETYIRLILRDRTAGVFSGRENAQTFRHFNDKTAM